MMKSLLRWSTTLSLVGSTVLGTWFGSTEALALPAEQVVQKLRPVPVFTVADEQGAPLVASGENNAKVAGVFISRQDAQEFVQRLQTEKPELGSKVQVVPVSLGEVYQLAQSSETQQEGLNFTYVPMQEEVDEAKQLLVANGQEYQGGVPLFVAKGGEEDGYLMIEQNNQQVIPFFFEKEQLQQLIERFKEQKPELASTIKVEVVVLEGMISTLQESDNELLNKIVLVPSAESIEFLRSAAQQQNQNQQ